MVNIRDFTYDAPIDNVNVAFIKPSRISDNREAYKAFQVIDNIWVVPERYKWDGSLDPINKETQLYVYDRGAYLSTDNDRNDFLLTITKILKRINLITSPSGSASFLEALRIGTPLSHNKVISGTNYKLSQYNSVNIMQQVTNGQWQPLNKKIAHVIIYGPDARLNHAESTYFITNDIHANCHGSLSEIRFHPSYLTSFFNGRAYCEDPAIALAHELTHCLHALYGLRSGKEITFKEQSNVLTQQEQRTIRAEEVVTFGGIGLERYQSELNGAQKAQACENLYDIVKQLNKYDFGGDQALRAHYINKYNAVDVGGEIFITRARAEDYYNRVKFAYNEVYMSQKLGVITANYYHQKGSGLVDREVKGSLLDDNIYTIESGFVKGQSADNNSDLRPVYTEKRTAELCTAERSNRLLSSCVTIDNDELPVVPGEKTFADITIEGVDIDHAASVSPDLTQQYREHLLNDWKTSYFDTNSVSVDNELMAAALSPQSTHPGGKNLPNRTIFTNDYTPYHYLKAAQFDSSLDVKKEKIDFTLNMEEALENPKLVFTDFRKTAAHINSTISPLSDVLSFAQYTQQLIADFSDESGQTKKFDIAADALSIVPYVGPILGLAKSLTHNDFEGAIINGGIIALLIVAPELELPVVLALTFKQLIDEENLKEKARATVENGINHRRDKYDEVYSFITCQWRYGIEWQLMTRIQQIRKHLDWQLAALKANLTYHKAQYKGAAADIILIDKMITNAAASLEAARDQAIKNATAFIYQLSLKHLTSEMIPKALENLKDFDQKTKANLDNFLKQVSGGIGTELFQELEQKVNAAFAQQITYSMPDHLFENELQKVITINEMDRSQNLVLQLAIDEQDRIRDASGNNANITVPSGVDIVEGRDNKAIRIKNDNSKITITNDSLLTFSEAAAFTVTFWLRLPAYKRDQSFGRAITLFSRGKKEYWKLSVKDGGLRWQLKGSLGTVELVSPKVALNRWFFVALKYDPTRNIAEMLVFLKSQHNYSHFTKGTENIGELPGTDDIILAIEGARTVDYFVRFDQWNMYRKYLATDEIVKRFASYFSADAPVDYWGERLRIGREYYLSLSTIFGYGNAAAQDDNFVKIIESKLKRLNDYRLYGGTKIKFLNVSHNALFVNGNEKYFIESTEPAGRYFFPVDAQMQPGYDALRLMEEPGPVNIHKSWQNREVQFTCLIKLHPVPQHTGGYMTTIRGNWLDITEKYIFHDVVLAHNLYAASEKDYHWVFIPEDEGWID